MRLHDAVKYLHTFTSLAYVSDRGTADGDGPSITAADGVASQTDIPSFYPSFH